MNYRKVAGWAMILFGLISLILLVSSASHLMHAAFTSGSSPDGTHSLDHLEDQTMLWNVCEVFCTVAFWIAGGFLLAPRRTRKALPPPA